MSEKELCARDLSILDLLFDPSQGENNVKDLSRPINDDVDAKDHDEGSSEEIVKSKTLELEGVNLSEAGKLDEALVKFNEAILIATSRPSPYNNRAQLYRFLKKDDLALADLSRSIELSGDSFPLTKCRALCQQGMIRRKTGDVEGARESFNESAKLGSKFARQQLVDLNPYAQLCNQMVTKLLSDMK